MLQVDLVESLATFGTLKRPFMHGQDLV
jgi:hypothetical protein